MILASESDEFGKQHRFVLVCFYISYICVCHINFALFIQFFMACIIYRKTVVETSKNLHVALNVWNISS